MNEDTQHSESAVELRVRQLKKYMTIALVVLLFIGILQALYTYSIKQNETAALANSQVQAQVTKDSNICQIYPNDELCIMAREVLANPKQEVKPDKGDKGEKGDSGPAGRGVTTFKINATGSLEVNYTDGSTDVIGQVVGKDGATGANGTNGINGVDGEDGLGILSTALESGSLIVRYTDGSTQNLGYIVGPAGQDGTNGTNGTNGVDGAQGPQGPEGPAGVSVTSISVDNTGNVLVQYSNNTSAIAGQVIVNTITSMICNKDTNILTITVADGTAFTTTVDCTPEAVAAPVPQPTQPQNPQPQPQPTTSSATLKQ